VSVLPTYLEEINEVLMRHASGLKDPGLLHGKMGISLYFFYLAKHTENKEHQNFAETLLDEVYEHIQHHQTACGFADGLAGIAWAITHLVENQFVEADVDEVLSDADDKIYHHLHQSQEIDFGVSDGLLGYLYYVFTKLQWRKTAKLNDDFVFVRLFVDLLNRLSSAIDEKRWRLSEPPFFNLNWDLSLLLLLVGEIKRLNFYDNKLEKIINSLSPLVLSYFPYQHANKVYLLYSLRQLLRHFDLPAWKSHAAVIQEQTDYTLLLNKEMGDKNIFFSNGMAGLAFILQELGHPVLEVGTKHITNKIVESQFFGTVVHGDAASAPSLGFLNGLSGIGFQFLRGI
jgi:lantibiotic modifying enzyme